MEGRFSHFRSQVKTKAEYFVVYGFLASAKTLLSSNWTSDHDKLEKEIPDGTAAVFQRAHYRAPPLNKSRQRHARGQAVWEQRTQNDSK